MINSNRNKRRNGKSRRELRERGSAPIPEVATAVGERAAAQGGSGLLPPSARPPVPPTYRRRAPDAQHPQPPRAGPHRPGGARPPGRGGALGRPVPLSGRTARGHRRQPRTLSNPTTAARCPLWAAGEAPAARRRQ